MNEPTKKDWQSPKLISYDISKETQTGPYGSTPPGGEDLWYYS